MTAVLSPVLSISLFGPLLFRQGSKHAPLCLTGATRELLTLLLSHPNIAQRREQLVARLWLDAEPAKGRSALTTALWRINKRLEVLPGLEICCFDDLVLLQPGEGVAIDGPDMMQLIESARWGFQDEGVISQCDRRALGRLLRGCTGDYLEGCDGSWALTLRAEMETRRLQALDLLMRDAEARGAFEDALIWGQAMLSLDPLRESVYHEMIRLYAACGDRHQAILTYEALRNVLHRELQIDPDPMTTALRDKILQERTCRRRPGAAQPVAGSLLVSKDVNRDHTIR